MTDSVLPIIHSVLDADAVGECIRERFGFSGLFQCELLTRGMNDVYLVRSGGDRFASRVWRHAFRDEAMVAYELAFLSHLRRAGLPVVSARRTTEGAFHVPVQAPEGERYLALFDWEIGRAHV